MSYRKWVFIAIILFSIGLTLGLSTPAGIASFISEDITALKEFGDFLTSVPRPVAATLIFGRNALTLCVSFFFSPILCLPPILALTVNGWLITFVSTKVIQEKSLGFLLAGLLPHGIFELPALILGQAAALSFGAALIVAIFKVKRRHLLLPALKQEVRHLTVALVLLLPAAIIETYITPMLLTIIG